MGELYIHHIFNEIVITVTKQIFQGLVKLNFALPSLSFMFLLKYLHAYIMLPLLMLVVWAFICTQVGTEISFKLPISSSSSFESMFREIESCMRSSICNSEIGGDDDYCSLGIESCGISVTTLEEVFLRVAGSDFDEAECIDQSKKFVLPNSVDSQACCHRSSEKILQSKLFGNFKNVMGIILSIAGRACSLFFGTVFSFINFLSMLCCSCCLISRSTFWEHSKALLLKRAISARRDRKTFVFQILIPSIFLLFGLLLLKLKPHPDQQSVTFSTSHFNPLLSGGGGGGPIPFDLSWPISKEVGQ